MKRAALAKYLPECLGAPLPDAGSMSLPLRANVFDYADRLRQEEIQRRGQREERHETCD